MAGEQNGSAKPAKPQHYRTNPVMNGYVHNSQFNNSGVSVEPITAADIERLKEAFPGVEFIPTDAPAAGK